MGWGLASCVDSHDSSHEVWQPLLHGRVSLQSRCGGCCQTAWITSAAPAKATSFSMQHRGTEGHEQVGEQLGQHAGTDRDPQLMTDEEIEEEKAVIQADIQELEAKMQKAREGQAENRAVPRDEEMAQEDLRSPQFEEEQEAMNVQSKTRQTYLLDEEAAMERIVNNKKRLAELVKTNVVFTRPKMASAEEERPGELSMPDPLFDQLRIIDPSISPPPADLPSGVPDRCRPGPEVLMDLSRVVMAPIGDLISIKPPLVAVEAPAPAPEIPQLMPKPLPTGPLSDSQVSNMPVAALHFASLGPRQMPTKSQACDSAAARGRRRMRQSEVIESAREFL